MGKTAEGEISSTTSSSSSSSSLCFKLFFLSVAAFVPSLIFICFLTYGFSAFLVSISVLFLSTMLIIRFSKKKVVTVEHPTHDESSLSSPKNLLVKEAEEKLIPEVEAVTLCNADQQSEVSEVHDYQVESTDFPSASDSGDDLSDTQNFELNWMSFNNVGKNVAISEISDSSDDEEEEDEDDNLIEISFPDTNSVELDEDSEEKLQTILPESAFKQEGLMELLADINEVNEEENLIEIDLSMGYIKG